MTAKPHPSEFKARFTTSGNVASVHSWLDLNIKGKWSLRIDSVSDDLLRKSYAVIFSEAADLGRFRAAYGGKTPAPGRR